jgi:hypothetical protein
MSGSASERVSAGNARDRRYVADEVEFELFIESRADRVADSGDEKGVAIWYRVYEVLAPVKGWPKRSASQ